MTWTRRLLGLGLAVLLIAACAGGGDGDESGDTASADGAFPSTTVPMDRSEAAAGGADASAPANDAAGESADGDTTTDAARVADRQIPDDRRIIRTANVLTEVRDVVDAAAEVRAAALASDGFLFSQELAEEYGTVVVKVPAGRFDGALETVVGIGEVRRQSTSAEDVTAAYADLEGRLEALQTSIDRLLGFLAEATDIGEVASLESELTRREAERDSIAGQLQVLENQTAFSTITVELSLPDNLPDNPDDDRDGFLGGLDDGLDVLGAIGSGLATVVGFALPFLPAVAAAAGVVWWLLRRRARRVSARPSETLPSPPSPAEDPDPVE